jgi:hypothetical protein
VFFDHSAPVLGDLRVDQFGEMSLQALVCTFFIRAHQARIAGNIDRQDRRQSSLDPPLAHLAGPVLTGRSAAEEYNGTQPDASTTSAPT